MELGPHSLEVPMLLALLALLPTATATPLPPDGSSLVVALLASNDTVTACGVGGCASSSDGGASWRRPADHAVLSTVSNLSRGRLAMTEEGRILLSTDLGSHWSSWNEGIPADQFVEGVVIEGTKAFAATTFARRSPGLTTFADSCVWYVRSEGASAWVPLDTARSYYPGSLAIGYAGTLLRTTYTETSSSSGPRIETSSDDGRSWDTVRTAARLLRIDAATLAVAFNAQDSALLSRDSGRTWAPVFGKLYRENFLDGAVLYDGDTTWRSLRTGAPRRFALDSIGTVRAWARAGSRLWANGNYGLFVSSDSGATWKRADASYPLGISPALRWRGDALYSVPQSYRSQAIARSSDDGSSWTRLTGWQRGIDELEDCPYGLMATTSTGTLVANGSSVAITASSGIYDIACTPTGAYALVDDGWTSWSGTAWAAPSSSTGLRNATQIAATSAGTFAIIDDYDNDMMRLDFLANGTQTVVPTNLTAYVKSITGSPRGVWASTARGLHFCSSASDCRPVNPAGTDTLWAFSTTNVQGSFVLTSGVPYGTDLVRRNREARLFASSDSGRTWTSFALPTIARDAAVTPSGIVANLYGAGLWKIASDSFRVTGIGPRSVRASTPGLRAVGRILTVTGIVPGARLRVLDASGRAVLDLRPDVVEGTSRIALPATARGVLFAAVESAGARTGFQWVATDH